MDSWCCCFKTEDQERDFVSFSGFKYAGVYLLWVHK